MRASFARYKRLCLWPVCHMQVSSPPQFRHGSLSRADIGHVIHDCHVGTLTIYSRTVREYTCIHNCTYMNVLYVRVYPYTR